MVCGRISPQAEDLAKRIRETIQGTGDFRCDGAKDVPDDDHGDCHDANDEFDQPPGDEDRAEENFEEDFHLDVMGNNAESAPLALAGEEFEDLFKEEPDHPDDGFDFDEHNG